MLEHLLGEGLRCTGDRVAWDDHVERVVARRGRLRRWSLSVADERLGSGFELHAERVEHEQDEVVVADEHRDFDELLLVVVLGEPRPRRV